MPDGTTANLVDPRIAGALFDFAGYLTCRPAPLVVGSSYDATHVIKALQDWSAMRGLCLDEADVKSWHERGAA